ncbi:MAG: SIMPL domain-containing protein [Bryobacteraceae bacterium]
MKSNRLGLAMILVGGLAGAQVPRGTPMGTPVSSAGAASVRAAGDGVVYAKPDQAKIDIGVVTQAATAQAAGAQNAARTQAVLERLHSVLGSRADIRTISYSLNPNYQYPHDGGKPTIDGYNASNTVEITSDDLAGIGKVVDAATAGGANQIERLQFLLKDEKPARAEALRKAAQEARSNAQAMAAALGLKLGRVLSVEQSTAQPIEPMMNAFTRINTAATPIEAGAIEVRASVTLTVAVE